MKELLFYLKIQKIVAFQIMIQCFYQLFICCCRLLAKSKIYYILNVFIRTHIQQPIFVYNIRKYIVIITIYISRCSNINRYPGFEDILFRIDCISKIRIIILRTFLLFFTNVRKSSILKYWSLKLFISDSKLYNIGCRKVAEYSLHLLSML